MPLLGDDPLGSMATVQSLVQLSTAQSQNLVVEYEPPTVTTKIKGEAKPVSTEPTRTNTSEEAWNSPAVYVVRLKPQAAKRVAWFLKFRREMYFLRRSLGWVQDETMHKTALIDWSIAP